MVGGDVPATLIALVADGSVPASRLLQVVAAVVGQVPDHELAVLVQVTQQMLGLRVLLEAVPVAAVVEGVRMPASPELSAVNLLILGRAVGGHGGRGIAIVVALVADWPPVTLDVLLVVAAVVSGAVHLGRAVLGVRAQDVLGAPALDAVPVLAAVVGIRIVARS